MKGVFVIIVLGLFLLVMGQVGCRDITVGYLETRDAVYQPDSMIVKAELDSEIDARQIEFGIP